MQIPETLLEIRQYSGEGYRPLVDFGAWRVAILRFCDELRPENLTNMQRHDETDEVFVLLAGRCILYLGEGQSQVEALHAVDLAPLKLYNVKQGVWHTHALSEDATVLVVENRMTTDENSPRVALSSAQQEQIVRLARLIIQTRFKILLANTKRPTEPASDKPNWQAGLYQVAGP